MEILEELKAIITIDKYIVIYLCMVVIDLITGILKAFKNRDFKSSKMREGIIKVIAELLGIIFGALLDKFFGINIFMVSIEFLLIATQGLSIIENLALLGFNVPTFIAERLRDVQDNANKGNKEE